jgi:hypothetical protein
MSEFESNAIFWIEVENEYEYAVSEGSMKYVVFSSKYGTQNQPT